MGCDQAPPRTPRQRRELLAQTPRFEADAMLVSKPAGVRYLSGFTGEGLLLSLRDGSATISTDGRYELTAARECPDCEVIVHPEGHIAGVLQRCERADVESVLFENDVLTVAQYDQLDVGMPNVELHPVTWLVEELRQIKDSAEIAAIGRAAAIVDEALTSLLSDLRPGPSEREVQFELERAILMGGAEGISFLSIVACGAAAACPHATPSSAPLEVGQMVKIDVGAVVDGYCSDITRTVFLDGGAATAAQRARFDELYQIVLSAQQAALGAVRPGLECAALDAVARDLITEAGYGPQFSHGLGHGVGLEIHEPPVLSRRSTAVLQAGMVITIEPGIYIEGWGGIRIEDLILVTCDGARVLTSTPRTPYFSA